MFALGGTDLFSDLSCISLHLRSSEKVSMQDSKILDATSFFWMV
jgi:hypothetical protein